MLDSDDSWPMPPAGMQHISKEEFLAEIIAQLQEEGLYPVRSRRRRARRRAVHAAPPPNPPPPESGLETSS